MATSTISNTIKAPDGTAIASVPVTVTLMPSAGFRESDFTEVARIVTTTSNGSGFWSLSLERNANITPDNSWYEVIEHVPAANGGKRVWQIAVGDSDQTLLASLVTPATQQPTVVPAGTVYLTQASADARYQALAAIGATPNTIEPDDAASAGVSSSAARADHEHGIVTATPTGVGLAGTNSEGASTSFARANHVHAYNPPACRVYHSANQSLTDNTDVILAFNSERHDTDSMHDNSTNNSRITINTAGVYVLTAHLQFASGNDYSWVQGAFRIDGTTLVGVHRQPGTNVAIAQIISLSAVYKLSAGQYVEILARHDNTANTARNVEAAGNWSPEFSATWIGVG